jgi:Tfp pilus assembly PilM family ATPase
MTTSTAARYEISDRKTGDIIFTQDIASTGTTPFDYAFSGATRVQESVNRAVQNNITQFLQALESVDVKKPMFPQSSGAKK